MSGTSLDGVDIAYCHFERTGDTWTFRIIHAETIPYDSGRREKLKQAPDLVNSDLTRLDVEYGKYLGDITREFCNAGTYTPDFIASHGHTIYHRPEKSLTLQIGHGPSLAIKCGYPVVYDFRSGDVSLGGQGAPLVPVGDRELFGEFDFCLNMGGFSNISFDDHFMRKAYDICPVNIILNKLALCLGIDFDRDGLEAGKGRIDMDLLDELNSIPYFSFPPPKSLGREWLEDNFLPVMDASKISVRDKLRTATEHIAFQIGKTVSDLSGTKRSSMLITGGGAKNRFLIDRISTPCPAKMIIPDESVLNYKEALIFAFLGVLRWRNEINILSSVTGATMDSSGGTITFPGD